MKKQLCGNFRKFQDQGERRNSSIQKDESFNRKHCFYIVIKAMLSAYTLSLTVKASLSIQNKYQIQQT